MKSLFLLLVFSSLFTLTAYSQTKENKLKKNAVPDVVTNSFSEKFLNAKKTAWYKDESKFLAVFFSDGYKLHAFYTANGKWQETRLFDVQLPPDIIKNHFGSFYGDWVIRKKMKVESANANYYLLEVHFDAMIRELMYDEAGNLLKEKIINQ